MTIRVTRSTAALALVLAAGAAHAQGDPTPTTPNAITPPNGVARGVVKPNRPVDSKMITQPPAHGRQTMPVIKPPAASR